ncbi:DUF6929 family protein [Flavobacterium sp. JP2137]|uniref:DUF6929 family protein n=1 Tax=Flavobacterium sp. JP2137 TaxID=3414510 RepID=UPI003D2FE3E1
MKKFTLELFIKIIGISAASGIGYQNEVIHLISDSADVLYEYHIKTEKLSKTALNESGKIAENLSKVGKSDFEAMTSDGSNYYIFGSGSGALRNTLIEINQESKEVISINDLSVLYESMKSFAGIDDKNFNIEGVSFYQDKWYFLNRGNGPQQQNGLFTITGDNLLESFNIVYNPIKLPKIDGVQAGFTDACVVDGQLYFLAAAEDSGSTYLDGAVKGSLIGRIDLQKMKVKSTKIISKTHKFEGLTHYSQDKNGLSFLLCEDADSDTKQADIYKIILK